MLSPNLQQFIARYVDSMETLEILLLLQRAPDTFWTPSAIDSHLGMKSGVAENRLRGLLENNFVTKGISGGYRYNARGEERRVAVLALAAAYAETRAEVVNAVYSENLNRLRAFSDAFRVKSE